MTEKTEEEMLTLTTIRRSPGASLLVAHLEKSFTVEQISAEKFSIRAPSLDKVGNEIERFAKEFHKEMEYSATAKVGMTVFAAVEGATSYAYILTNERRHLSKQKAQDRRKNPPRV